MRAAEIFFLARVRRAAIVVLETRKACAMSEVLTPQMKRRVSTTWASRESAGWQQVKISRSRSSGTAPPSMVSITVGSFMSASSGSSGSTSKGSLERSVCPRRSASSALRLAAVVSQAPGLAGTPSRFQASSAVTYAFWTHSSARSRSRATRTVAASTKAHSWRCASATARSTEAARLTPRAA
jgi:hypothetical protein